MRNIDDIIEDFNDGETELVLKYFGDYQTFFKILDKRNRLDELIKPFAIEWENDILLYLYETDLQQFKYWCDKFLDDIEIVEDKIYCIRDAGDFGDLFCDNRDVSRSTIVNILEGNTDFDFYYESDIDVYQDVINELYVGNLQKLKTAIIKILEGKQILPETEILKSIAESQGHSDYVIIDINTIEWVFQDYKTMTYLLDNDLDDLKDDLVRVYNDSCHSVLENDYYKSVWDELTSSHFTGKPEYITIHQPNYKVKYIEKIKLEVSDFYRTIENYLSVNKGYSNGNLEYIGSYLSILKEESECLRADFDEYPDHREVDKLINELITDYI